VQDYKIADIKIIEGGQSEITSLIIDEIISSQNINIDTVSGASITTKAFLKAVEDALGAVD
jgi:uncharacterized protein with FMN-binding domain